MSHTLPRPVSLSLFVSLSHVLSLSLWAIPGLHSEVRGNGCGGCWQPSLHTHTDTHTQVNIHVLMPLLSLNQLGRCYVKHVCATAAWSVRACVCTHMCGCVCMCILPNDQNEIRSSGLLRVGWVPLLLPCGGIFKTVAHPQASALCSGSSAPLGLSPTPCCAYWNLGSQLSYQPIRKPFTKATANWISAPFPFQMRV